MVNMGDNGKHINLMRPNAQELCENQLNYEHLMHE